MAVKQRAITSIMMAITLAAAPEPSVINVMEFFQPHAPRLSRPSARTAVTIHWKKKMKKKRKKLKELCS